MRCFTGFILLFSPLVRKFFFFVLPFVSLDVLNAHTSLEKNSNASALQEVNFQTERTFIDSPFLQYESARSRFVRSFTHSEFYEKEKKSSKEMERKEKIHNPILLLIGTSTSTSTSQSDPKNNEHSKIYRSNECDVTAVWL